MRITLFYIRIYPIVLCIITISTAVPAGMNGRISMQESSISPWVVTHKSITHRFYWHYRLIVCGSAALLFSLSTWLLEVGIIWQLLSVVLGFLLGFLWPVQRSNKKSLNWLDEHIGLSYRSLLELNLNQKETFGFKKALQKRVEFLITRTKLPRMLPWWLLLLGLALGIAFLPNINLPTASESTALLLDDFSERVARAYNKEAKDQQDLQNSAEKTAENRKGSPFENQGDSSSISTNNSETDSELLTNNGLNNPTLVDNGVLEQLLENNDQIKENPANPFQAINSSPPQNLTETQAESNQQVNSSEDLQSAKPPLISDRPQTSLDSAVSQTESKNQQVASDEGEQIGGDLIEQPDNDSSGENEQSQLSNNESASEEDARTTEVAEAENNQSDNEQISQQQIQSIPTAPSASQGDNTGTDNSASATKPSEKLDSTSNEITRLEGKLIDGSSNLAGEISLPSVKEVNFPQVSQTPNNNFQYSAEEAITEGSIPLEYQEILRNYFR